MSGLVSWLLARALVVAGPKFHRGIVAVESRVRRAMVFENEVTTLLQESGVVPIYIDVGARRGVDIRHWRYRDHLSFWLFEPDPHEAEYLSSYYERVFNCALTDELGEVELHLTVDPGASYTSGNSEAKTFYSDDISLSLGVVNTSSVQVAQTISVPKKPLSHIAIDRQVAFLKVDVQGEELSVLRGMSPNQRPTLIKLEVAALKDSSGRSQLAQIIDWSEKNNYSLIGVKFDDHGLLDFASEFDPSIQGDILLIDESSKTEKTRGLICAAMLFAVGMAEYARYVLSKTHPEHGLLESHDVPMICKKILDFPYNNAHDRRRKTDI